MDRNWSIWFHIRYWQIVGHNLISNTFSKILILRRIEKGLENYNGEKRWVNHGHLLPKKQYVGSNNTSIDDHTHEQEHRVYISYHIATKAFKKKLLLNKIFTIFFDMVTFKVLRVNKIKRIMSFTLKYALKVKCFKFRLLKWFQTTKLLLY